MTTLAVASPQDMKLGIMLADIGVVLVAGAALGRLAQKLRQPVVVGEIVAGILLGPSVLACCRGTSPRTSSPPTCGRCIRRLLCRSV